MSNKNNTQVLINGQVYTLSGQESEEYIQKVALYINNKLDLLKKSDNGQLLSTRLLNVLLALNIADELFKANDDNVALNAVIDDRDRKINELQEIIDNSEANQNSLQNRISELEKDVAGYKRELDEYIDVFEQNH